MDKSKVVDKLSNARKSMYDLREKYVGLVIIGVKSELRDDGVYAGYFKLSNGELVKVSSLPKIMDL